MILSDRQRDIVLALFEHGDLTSRDVAIIIRRAELARGHRQFLTNTNDARRSIASLREPVAADPRRAIARPALVRLSPVLAQGYRLTGQGVEVARRLATDPGYYAPACAR